MEAYVVQTEQLFHEMDREAKGKIYRTMKISVKRLTPSMYESEESEAYCNELNKKLKELQGNSAERALSVDFCMSKPATCYVNIHGKFLQSFLPRVSDTLPTLRLIGESPVGTVQLSTTEMSICFPTVLSTTKEGGLNGTDPFCEDRYAKITSQCETNFRSSMTSSLYITLIFSDRQYDKVPDKMSTMKKILNERIQTDFTLITSDGGNLSCNKAFLAAHSTVLEAMLKADMTESKTNKMEMNMTEESVKALLSYLYFWEIKIPSNKPSVALDLLQAGHKYEIRPLEESMRKIILAFSPTVMGSNDAMRLFLFARNVEGFGDLKMKAVQVLKCNSQELREAEGYKNLVKLNSGITVEAAMELAAIVLSLCDCDITNRQDPITRDKKDTTTTPIVATLLKAVGVENKEDSVSELAATADSASTI